MSRTFDRLADRMHHHDRAHIRGYAGNELLDAHAVAARLGIGEAWHQAIKDDRRKGARIGDRRHDHLAAFRQTKRRNRDEQCSGPGGNRVGITAAHLRDECVRVPLLKFPLVTWIEPALAVIADNLLDGRDFDVPKRSSRRHRFLRTGSPPAIASRASDTGTSNLVH